MTQFYHLKNTQAGMYFYGRAYMWGISLEKAYPLKLEEVKETLDMIRGLLNEEYYRQITIVLGESCN